ncbi:hypothetical protein EV702DRAFT_1199794 [Suillus placidus]|uniref:Uncharacterized protein n=1 Tax=Suillus placidus TaxID=48579 RepID=A0A9P6ZRJ3_9AGAM|nr:hypothetical protein EV702DRAFT_1199794 [Suillus placidus]
MTWVILDYALTASWSIAGMVFLGNSILCELRDKFHVRNMLRLIMFQFVVCMFDLLDLLPIREWAIQQCAVAPEHLTGLVTVLQDLLWWIHPGEQDLLQRIHPGEQQQNHSIESIHDTISPVDDNRALALHQVHAQQGLWFQDEGFAS